MRPTSQLTLPLAPALRVRHGRRVSPQAESDDLYAAVLFLRRDAGRTVYRAGAEHQVDGESFLSTREQLDFAHHEAQRLATSAPIKGADAAVAPGHAGGSEATIPKKAAAPAMPLLSSLLAAAPLVS